MAWPSVGGCAVVRPDTQPELVSEAVRAGTRNQRARDDLARGPRDDHLERVGRFGAAVADPRWLPAIGVVAALVILYLARDLSFNGDEWAFIVDRRLTIDGLLQPHNEHLAALHVLVYRTLVEVFGTGSYLPFMVVLMTLHLAAAGGLYVLLAQRVSPIAAMAATILFLFLGSGFDNLLWAFQIGFVGSVVLGVWALVVVDRPWLSATLVTMSIWTSGVGLFFIAPLAILIRRRVWLAMPVCSYAAWLLLVGRESIPVPAPGPYLAYAVTAVGSTFAGISGVGFGGVQANDWLLGVAVAVIVGLGVTVPIVRGATPSRFVLAGAAGLLSEYAILAFGRAHFGTEQAMAPRYIYIAFPFVMLVLTGLPRLPRAVWVALFVLALASNLVALPRGVAIYEAFLRYDRSIPLEQRLAPFR
jgi:hypothetical protein